MRINNQRKRLLSIILIIFYLFTFTGCSPKTPISVSDFTNKMETLGYEVIEDSEQCGGNGSISKCLYIEKGSIFVSFVVFSSKDYAVRGFNIVKKDAEYFQGGSYSTSSRNASNYSTYTLSSGDSYFYIVRIDNTLFYASCDKSEKKTLDEIIEVIGYK